jgi:hypothetical protein
MLKLIYFHKIVGPHHKFHAISKGNLFYPKYVESDLQNYEKYLQNYSRIFEILFTLCVRARARCLIWRMEQESTNNLIH